MSQYSLIGKTLRGRYQIRQKIGEGGFGDTYRAIDFDLPGKPTCVVKHLKPKNRHPALLEIAKKKFDREAQTLYRLGNGNEQIPRLFAHFEEKGEFYLVQEFIDGHDLTKEICSGEPKSEKELIKLLREILEVLAFVHQQNIIHRDIKPQNIRRRKDGKIVLIDFGIVKEIAALGIHRQGEIPRTVAVGTPNYMPSEQQSGRPQLSSDIYALGIIAFLALTGYRNPGTLPRTPDTGELSCTLFPEFENISTAFAEILDKMVRYDYRQRYQNATVALEAVDNLLELEQAPTMLVGVNPNINKVQPNTNLNRGTSIESENTSLFGKVFGFVRNFWSESKSGNSSPSITSNSGSNSGSFEQPEGQVSLNSAFYIERPPIEDDCYETILQSGALVRIKAPRQMGKTSLLSRILDLPQSKTVNLHI
ncbi:hypothetical protein BC008_45175 [Mastigocoleus testarum BC008]|uniref:non-specific serine/threonine protein kinase n=1 Tax=Mastigocoleus testarum BC008 TaxID=371196 RepID=A0A0V8A0T2_9CYAN|nr:hypothetical protein BC008_45175 [Mastigocoleus testarum BC008]